MPDDEAAQQGQFKKIPESAGTEAASGTDIAGEREATALGAGTLEEQTLALTRSLRTHINWAILCLVWLSAILIAAALIVVAIHHLTAWHWLTETQLAILDTLLFRRGHVPAAG